MMKRFLTILIFTLSMPFSLWSSVYCCGGPVSESDCLRTPSPIESSQGSSSSGTTVLKIVSDDHVYPESTQLNDLPIGIPRALNNGRICLQYSKDGSFVLKKVDQRDYPEHFIALSRIPWGSIKGFDGKFVQSLDSLQRAVIEGRIQICYEYLKGWFVQAIKHRKPQKQPASSEDFYKLWHIDKSTQVDESDFGSDTRSDQDEGPNRGKQRGKRSCQSDNLQSVQTRGEQMARAAQNFYEKAQKMWGPPVTKKRKVDQD